MPIPLDRVAVYVNNAAKLMTEFNQEFNTCDNFKRQMQIYRDSRLVLKITKAMILPYMDILRDAIPEDILRNIGLI